MQSIHDNQIARPDMKSICCPDDIWNMAKEVSKAEGRSISSMIRENIKRHYARLLKKSEIKNPI